ncbi:MAG: recombinase family protein [Dysosmobacter sp.]|nr:recombinase family protein [Dysosmobacter sp.]
MEQTVQRQVRVIPATKQARAAAPRRGGKQRVAAYCRVSTDSEEQLNSYAAQKNYYTQKIEENPDWEMAGVFADEGLSGTSMKKRKEFNRMIAACKRGRVDMILTKSLSRFARNTVDCLKIVRLLKAQGIGVMFEKENINTLTESSEFLITLFSGFAQAESESMSRNIIWGKQKSGEAGHVAFQYKKLLGYRRGPDGGPEIVPEEAEMVRRIFRRYLEGASLGDIKKELEADGVPTAEAVEGWSYQVIRNILTNEKYCGDALLFKTRTLDPISKKTVKNTGEWPMVYIEGNHEGIVPKAVFLRVQEEMARRASKRKVMQKHGRTEQGKYSGRYALTELLVCGECGSPYKRCTWARNGKKRIVWRCVSRLEFGTKYCHNSPTLDEDRLHRAILGTLNEYGAARGEAAASALKLARMAQGGTESGDEAALRQRLDELGVEQAALVDQALKNMEDSELNARMKAVVEEKQDILNQLAALQKETERQALQASRRQEMEAWLTRQPDILTEYDDGVTRRLVERITVVDAETIRVKLKDTDVEIEQKMC